MNPPLISILIPMYQSEKYIARSLESALGQTYPRTEIVVVDDGSTDESCKLAKEYQNKWSQIRVFSTDHLGVSYARQELLAKSQGEYVFFLDADDFIDPCTLEILEALARQYNADVVQCEMNRTSQDKRVVLDYHALNERVYTTYPQVISAWHQKGWQSTVAAKLYRRQVFQGVNFPIGKIHEDEAVMHRLLANCGIMVATELPLYYYYKNPVSIMNKPFTVARYDALDALEDRVTLFQENGLVFQTNMVRLRYCFLCVELYRNTYRAFGPGDPHLPWLLNKYEGMAELTLESGYFEGAIATLLRGWIQNPLQGEVPYYWHIARNLFQEWDRGTIQ